MEAGNGVTVILPEAGGAAVEAARGPVVLGPAQTQEACVVIVGALSSGDPGPPLHFHPYTDEAFYIPDGELTFRLGDRNGRRSGPAPRFPALEKAV